MKQINNLKAAAIYMLAAFVSIFVCGSIVSCGELEDNQQVASVKFTVDPDTVENRDTTTIIIREEYRDSLVQNPDPIIIVVWDSLRNDTVVEHKETKASLTASASRNENELKVTASQLATLRYTGKAIERKQDGRGHLISKSKITDNCGQTYNASTDAVKAALKKYSNIHLHVDTVVCSLKDSTRIQPKAGEVARYDWTTELVIKGHAVNTPSNKAWEIHYDLKDQRYIVAAAPDEPKLDSIGYKLIDKGVADGTHNWELQRIEYWSNDSTWTDSEKEQTIWSATVENPADRIVNSFDNWNYSAGILRWNNDWTKDETRSNANRTSMIETGYKKGTSSNGIDADTYTANIKTSHEKVTRVWGGHTWNIPADDIQLNNVQTTYLDDDSDRDGYSMLVFKNIEKAVNGNFSKNLKETCKLYLKVAAPAELDKIEFIGTKIHANNKVSIDGSVIPVFTDGSKGGAISFKWSKAESWYWKNDSVIAEGVTFVNQTTGELKLKGDVKESKKTFATDNDEVTIECTQFDADFELPVTVDGVKKMTTWHATWFENFYVVYQGKKVALTKSSYSVKAQNDKLTKDEARSNATSEVWGYSVEGIFSIDEDSRSAMGYGRLTKAIEEVVINEGWDKFSFDTDAKEYTDRVEYFLKWIREYSTGKKTSQEVKVVLKRNAEGSAYTITVDNPIREIGSQTESSSYVSRTESASDIVISYDWLTSKFELPNVFDGSIEKSDIATFVDPTNVKVTKKNSKGEDVTIDLPSFEHELTSTVSDLQMVSETEELVQYTYARTWSWASSQCTSTAKSIGNINKVPEYGGGEPDFDIEVGKIIATVSRPSNRDAADITAYTYLLVSKDGKKCLPIGIYHDVVTEGSIEEYKNGMNSACYVKDQNKVVATTATLASGIIKYKDANGNMVDGGMFLTWQGAGFNDRGNDYLNHTGKYAPKATKVGNIVKVTFEGTNVSYTFRGWDVH